MILYFENLTAVFLRLMAWQKTYLREEAKQMEVCN